MKTIDHEFYYEFRVADDVRMIYTKKPFHLNLRELNNDNLNLFLSLRK